MKRKRKQKPIFEEKIKIQIAYMDQLYVCKSFIFEVCILLNENERKYCRMRTLLLQFMLKYDT